MVELSRPAFIELLNRLGAKDDETVLKAARELHRSVTEAGVTWDDLLQPEEESGEAGAEPGGQPAAAAAETVADPESPSVAQAEPVEPEAAGAATVEPGEAEAVTPAAAEAKAAPKQAAKASKRGADWSEEQRIIDRLLGRKGISDTLRDDLQHFQRAIADGSFDQTDADYLRALAKRLGVK